MAAGEIFRKVVGVYDTPALTADAVAALRAAGFGGDRIGFAARGRGGYVVWFEADDVGSRSPGTAVPAVPANRSAYFRLAATPPGTPANARRTAAEKSVSPPA